MNVSVYTYQFKIFTYMKTHLPSASLDLEKVIRRPVEMTLSTC